MSKSIDQLIVNNPYIEPTKYWLYNREDQSFELKNGRRNSGYWKKSDQKLDENDFGEFIEIELVNRIRPRVKKWREENYPNVTPTTKRLLDFWRDKEQREQNQNPFFCQMEAVETAIWLTEAIESEKQGIKIPSDGDWLRECLKLATGTGKTVVMSMLITWHVLNKLSNPKDPRYSKNILIITPGITVKDRLSVLNPNKEDNFYKAFRIVDDEMWKKLLQSKILITNWHNLADKIDDNKKGVLKRGTESDEAFCKRVLGEFGDAKNILVINDEAHHCWRFSEKDEDDENKEKATIWVNGLDKIDNARKILKTYDLSATPFRPSGKGKQSEKLFAWIVSDFGLNDSIESGLVKTPRVAVRDDSTIGDDLKSKFFNIYFHVKDDLNRRVDEKTGLPDNSMHAVFFGSSFNVVDQTKALTEAARVLVPNGWFSCMWNHRDINDPTQKLIEQIIHSYIPHYEYGLRRKDPSDAIESSQYFCKTSRIEEKFFVPMTKNSVVDAWKSHDTLFRQSDGKFGEIIDAISDALTEEEYLIPYLKDWLFFAN